MDTIYIESLDENCKPDTDKPFERTVVRKPKPPKVAKVVRFKQVGSRSWSTIYRVKNEDANILYSHEILKDAIEYAKALSIKTLKEYYITVDKALTNSDPRVATISPGKFQLGKFKFSIIA